MMQVAATIFTVILFCVGVFFVVATFKNRGKWRIWCLKMFIVWLGFAVWMAILTDFYVTVFAAMRGGG